ncbi:MAG: indole-3-glycerol phosphate synthase TrpC [Candidatus Omnitrophota bacterium]
MHEDFLQKIVNHKKSLLEQKKAFFSSLKAKVQNEKLSRYRIFKEAISKPGPTNLIAEIKKASPSKGMICRNFDVLKLAEIYQANGAAAISVLTEEKYFLGKWTYLRTVGNHFSIPTLAKDFFIDEVHVYEAFVHGASAILLIVALLADDQLKHLMDVASNLDMECLVEVHDENELQRALKVNADIIGVNNRDLHSLTVDFKTCERLIPMIPKDKIIVAESGIQSHQEVVALKNMGVHAVLIGEAFLRAHDVSGKIKEIMYGES